MAARDLSRQEPFLQCPACKKILFAADYEAAQRVCSHCGHHGRLGSRKRIELTFDPGTFEEYDREISSEDPLTFPEYASKLAVAKAKTDTGDSMISGVAELTGRKVAVAVADFAFMGGSMGSVAGEKVTRTLERAAELKMPAIIFCASGGARMQEGLLSLMQMAKTTAAAQRLSSAGYPYIAVFTDPTMAGVLASYASIADVILAEPKALVGFAGARVSKQAGVSRVPDDFQTAEWVFEKGMLDRIVARGEMRSVLSVLVRTLGGGSHGRS